MRPTTTESDYFLKYHYFWEFMPKNLNTYDGKMLVSEIRGGDYAHPGEELLIEIVLKRLSILPNDILLDAGSGLGGTAAYIQSKTSAKIVGIDIDKDAITYSKRKYPFCDFYRGRIEDVGKSFKIKFQYIFCFCSLYCCNSIDGCFASLSSAINLNGSIIISDYACHNRELFKMQSVMNDTPFTVIDYLQAAEKANCHLHYFSDITDRYLTWFDDLIVKIEKFILKTHSPTTHNAACEVKKKCMDIQKALREDSLRGVIMEFRQKPLP